jgi:hypothetical protein
MFTSFNKWLVEHKNKITLNAGCWWLKPIILATWEAETERMWFQASPGK